MITLESPSATTPAKLPCFTIPVPHYFPSAKIEQMISMVSAAFDVTTGQIMGDRKMQPLALARQVCYHLVYHGTHLSYTAVGRYFGKDHGAIMSGIAVVKNERSWNFKFARTVKALEEHFKIQPRPPATQGRPAKIYDPHRNY